MNSDYVLHSRWRMACGRESLWDALDSLLASDDPMAWWPAMDVANYDGADIEVRASSHFGYSLTFSLTRLQKYRPDRLTFASVGDLRGTAEVTFVGLGASESAMDINWRVSTDRRWMRRTAWLLRPIFVSGHHLVMRQGEQHLNAWLRRR